MTPNQQHAASVVPEQDERTNREVLRQYDRLRTVKSQLVRAGNISEDATPEHVIAELRRQIPPDLF